MIRKTFLLRPLAVAALFAVSGASQAAITVYTSQAAFDVAVTAKGTDTFAGLSITGTTPAPITTRTAGAYSYSVTTQGEGGPFFGAGTTSNPWLSTNTATDPILFYGFSASAIGGNFFGSDLAGAFAAGNITLTATDSLGATSTQTITGATVSSFLGFVSTGAMSTLLVTPVQPTVGFLWPTVDNLQLAVAVPEPETYALMLAGLGFVGFMARLRRG